MKTIYIFLFVIAVWSCSTDIGQRINLQGEWEFQMDTLDTGINERWYAKSFSDHVMLPGSMVKNGKGYNITMDTKWTGGIQDPDWYNNPNYAPFHDPENIRFPFWLQPEKKYTGAAWYRKTTMIPEEWIGRNVWLHLERPHWESTVWINGLKAGMGNSLATPHRFNISPMVQTGENVISIRIDNRIKEIDVGENSHSISDHTQTNWNGIVGDIFLTCDDQVYFKNIKVFPSRETGTVGITAIVENSSESGVEVRFKLKVRDKGSDKVAGMEQFKYLIPAGERVVNLDLAMEDEVLDWDEFNPNVYSLIVEMDYNGGVDKELIDFGFRDLSADRSGLSINGRRLFLRGTLECCIFPLTGFPPTEKEGWVKVFTAVKEYGLNHVRFHSWCPPEAAFEVADEMGIYLHVECSSWANQSTTLGSGEPVDDYIYEESNRIIDAYGNHPSFVMMAYGNEPGGAHHVTYLREFISYWKNKDKRRLYTSAAGWPLIDENDYHITHNNVRIQGWGQGLNSIINSQPPRTDYDWSDGISGLTSPMVSHEIGQWCVYPNFKEIIKYTGVLKPKNFEIFQESLEDHHMGQLADSFLLASGKLQALCYKADIEAALRTPTFGGFQLLDLHDFPGQGTALVGVLDAFWEEKGYITPEEFRRFCNTTVPLARSVKRIFTESDTLVAEIEVAHFGEFPLCGRNPKWEILQEGTLIAKGELGPQDIPLGNCIKLGKVIHTFKKTSTARKLTLEVSIDDFKNSWDLWVYPVSEEAENKEIMVVEALGPSVLKYLEDGGKVLLSLGKGKVASNMGGNIGVGFSSIFWNTAWTQGQKPHTLGILCDPKHPALELFPTEYHSNWQWWDAMSHCDAISLETFDPEIEPIVRIIDDWVSNRRLALLFETKIGKGKIIISGTDLVNNLDTRHEAFQLRKSLLNYMDGINFNPSFELSRAELESILK